MYYNWDINSASETLLSSLPVKILHIIIADLVSEINVTLLTLLTYFITTTETLIAQVRQYYYNWNINSAS